MSEWIEIGTIDDIPPLGSRIVKTGDGDIAIFRASDDRIFAIEDRCPHKGGPLSQGIVHGGRVTCPLHNWTIELETGRAVAPDKGCVKCYPLRIEGGSIFIKPER
mgnify:CR=1 FL=1